MIAMPLVGILLSYMDGRWLVALGVAFVAVSTLMFGNLTLDVSMASIVWPNLIQGLGMGLVIVPLMTMSVATVSKEKIGNASGIFNLMRNLGGSIGISISSTFLARMTQVHQSNLVSHLTPYDPAFQTRLSEISTGLGGGAAAQSQAYGILYQVLQSQSYVKAYIDMFYWTALIIALCLPGAWLMRRVRSEGGAGLH
jgi:DHA2 family multidrug resistance protein